MKVQRTLANKVYQAEE